MSFGERTRPIRTKEIVDERTILSHTVYSEASQSHAINNSEVSHCDASLDAFKIAIIPNSISEPIQEQHTMPSDIVPREVCTINAPNNNQGREESQESSDLPIGERLTITSATEPLVNNTVVCVSDTRQDNSIMSSNLKRTKDERKTSAIEEIGTSDEIIVSAGIQQPSTNPVNARTNTDSVTQDILIEKPSTHDKSSDLSFGEKLTSTQLALQQSDVVPLMPEVQMNNVQSTQEYTLTQCSNASIPTTIRAPSPKSLEDIMSQEWSEEDMLVSPSTHEKSPDFSFGEQLGSPARTNLSVNQIEGSFIMFEDTIEDSATNEDAPPVDEISHTKKIERPAQPTATEVLNRYPHLVLKLCDGEIINADSGERIANLSQFLAANNLPEPARSDSDSTGSSSPQLLLNNDYEVLADPSQPSNQDNIINLPPGQTQTLAQLNQSLVDHDETTILVINEAMSHDLQLSQPPSQQSSQLMLGHEEIVVTMSQSLSDFSTSIVAPINSPRVLEVNNIELLVTDLQDLLAGFPEGWWEGEIKMVYHTGEARWGGEGVPNEEMENVVRKRKNKTPTNADCITYLYEYIEMDDPRIEDHIYYRRCKPPTTIEEVYRRHTFRVRRRRHFARPAINIGGAWFPEQY